MPSLLLRIFLLYNLLNSILLFLTPKKLRSLLPSFFQTQNQPQPTSSSSSNFTPTHKKMDSTELNHVFQMFDRNGDGRITKAELNDSLENMGIFIPDKELTQMIKSVDVDGDGCVDVDEFRGLYNSIVNEKNGGDEEDDDEDMKEAFDVFDRNGDGFISVDELKCVLGSLGLKQGTSLEDCRTMIRKVDVDGDGLVNFGEFLQMMKGGVL